MSMGYGKHIMIAAERASQFGVGTAAREWSDDH